MLDTTNPQTLTAYQDSLDIPLESERLILKPFEEEHLTLEYVNWLNDPAVVKFSEQRHKTHTLESCKQYAEDMKRQQHYFWAIINKHPNKHIGNLTAYIDRHNLIADLAIMIGDTSFQGLGLGKEAWNLACDFLLTSGQIRKITAGTMAINQPMLNLMESSGMHIEGRRNAHFIVEGKPVDLIFAAKLATSAETTKIAVDLTEKHS